MLARLSLCLWFLLANAVAECYSQIPGSVQVGQSYTKEEINKAKQIVDATKDVPFNWNKGDFQIFEKGPKANGPLLWQVSDESIISIKEIEPNTRLIVDGIRAGDPVAKEHDYAPQKASYWKFKAANEGVTTIWIFANGENGGPPVVIAKMKVTVGKPKPPGPIDPPEPIDDITTKALRAELAKDRVKGLADNRHLSALGGIYEAASRDPLTAVKTAGDLDALLNSARLAAGIPEADKMLPAVREWLRADMVSKIASQPATVLTVDQKNVARALFVKYANALEALSK